MKIIKGDSLEAQMEHVDRILKTYSKRLHKTVTGVITSFPISKYSKVPADDDTILHYMFPISGKITIGGMFVEGMPKQGIDITTIIYRGSAVNSNTFFSKRQSTVIEPNADIDAGDRLVIKVKAIKAEEIISNIWIAFTWIPNIKDSEIKQFLITDLEKNKEDNYA